VDFERESLHDALERQGMDGDERVFFSWLGVTMYLRESAVDDVLRTVATCAPGTEIVFTFAQPPDRRETADGRLRKGEDDLRARRTGRHGSEHVVDGGLAQVHRDAEPGKKDSLIAVHALS